MDFIPLAIWVVGFLMVACYGERTYYQNGKSREWIIANIVPGIAWGFGVGFCVFLALGTVSAMR